MKQSLGTTVLSLALVAVMAVGCTNAPGPDLERTGIISFAPNITEVLFELGVGNRVVGVTSFCDYPPEAKNIPSVGGYFDPDLEKVVLLNPALIILQGKHQVIADLAAQNAITVAQVNMDSLDSIYSGIATIAAAVGEPTAGEALTARIKSDLDGVRYSVADLPRPRVLIITARQNHNLNSLYTVGRPSFVSELIDIAGGDNIYGDAEEPYLEASKETVVVKAPDVIIEFHAGENLSPEEQQRYVDDWGQLPSLPAVQNGRIYLILPSHALRPGPRVPEVARLLAGKLHPEAANSKE